MIRYYKYVFYKLYTFAKKLALDDTPQWTAMISMSILTFSNILTVLSIAGLIFELSYYQPLDTLTKKVLFMLVYLVLHYFIFIHNEKYKSIEKQFSDETKEEKKRGTIYTLFYIILTFGLFFLTMYLLMLRNRRTI